MSSAPSNTQNKSKVITLDGPAGAGKSTVAKRLAEVLNYSYLDTGAMYRAITLKAVRLGINLEDEDVLVKMAKKTIIDIEGDGQKVKVFLDGQDVSDEIRSIEITNKTFYIARAPRIREIMVGWQRDIGSRKSIVVEGRDVGTVVFPTAQYKFYLDADLEERSRRRLRDFKAQGNQVDPIDLMKELKERDTKDLTRSVGPLKRAEDAFLIDSTQLSIDQTVERILSYIKENPKK